MLGAGGGLAATSVMYLFLRPVARRQPMPPALIVARVGGMDPGSASSRVGGIVLQAGFGLFWGLIMAYWNVLYFPVGGSYMAQGLVWGLAAFTMSTLAFVALGIAGTPFDLRRWMGYLLCHLIYGACLGAAFVWQGPLAS